ncbi:hypothetical protein X975_01072, partial [Stegodyphus mimosarum]
MLSSESEPEDETSDSSDKKFNKEEILTSSEGSSDEDSENGLQFGNKRKRG